MRTHTPAVKSGTDLDTAARFMLFWDRDRIEVRDGETGQALGTLTEHDIVRLVAKSGIDLVATVDDALGAANSADVMELRAQDCMSNPVVAVHEDVELKQVVDLLGDREISGLPVVDDAGSVTGVISERDVAHAVGTSSVRRALGRPQRSGPFLRSASLTETRLRARDVMTRPPITIHPDTPMRTVAELMVAEGINRIPVVRNGRLEGIVTRGDVLGAVGQVETARDRAIHPPVVIGAAL